ncbi:MAG: class I SAM-dependent methyltransferase [Candidatus Omnitrophota bacterium]|nr:class I SAM-dependent methyltransferase [Candidatus Omnitrophota bacterium]
MQETSCPICGPGTPFRVRYPEKFDRSSLAFVARKTPDHTHFRIVQCNNCGLVYSNPILPEEDIRGLYRRSAFIHEEQLGNMLRDYLEQFEEILPLMNKENLLEVGCSSGFFLDAARRSGFENVRGVELSVEAVANAPESVRGSIVNDEFRTGIFPPGHFDAVCFFQVFDHVIDPNRFLQTAHHYLKPGGTLLAVHHDIRALMPSVLGARASTYDISHIHLWDKSTMRKILEKNGFRVRSIRNVRSRYQLDHVLRMLPLPRPLKEGTRALVKRLGLSGKVIKASVENMAVVAEKP